MRKDIALTRVSLVSSSSTIGSGIDRCFRETNIFSDFRFEDRIDNF